MSKNINAGKLNKYFIDYMPNLLAIIDENMKIVHANKYFLDNFGVGLQSDLESLKFFDEQPFAKRKFDELFSGVSDKTSYKTEYYHNNIHSHYTVNASILYDDGDSKQVLIIVNNISGTNHWQKEFNILFEKVPAFISILDKKHNIIRANERFRDTFGDVNGKHGYDAYHKKRQDIINCPAENTFKDTEEHISTVVGFTKNGEKIHLVISSVPFGKDENGISLVMEIALDITEISHLQDQLHQAHDFYNSIIENSVDGVIAVTARGKAQIINKEAKRILKWTVNRKPGINHIKNFMPEEFYAEPDSDGVIALHSESLLTDNAGNQVPVKFSAFELKNKKANLGTVAFFHDLTQLKSLERKQIEVEKEAFKYTFQSIGDNMLKIIELHKSSFDKFEESLSSIQDSSIKDEWYLMRAKTEFRNQIIEIFLRFARGYVPAIEAMFPNTIFDDLKQFVLEKTEKLDITFDMNISNNISDTYTDPNAYVSAIKIVLMNSILACIESDKIIGKIKVFADEREGHIIVDIFDNSNQSASKNDKIGFMTVDLILDSLNGILDVSENMNIGLRYSIIIPVAKIKR